ncbi:hypothetical protein F444_03844 [Phytophthora nicotianae P1976]|uniref:DDE Tnp4 domain-containing protein n=1 Tax=Phytophthora nicotianae P1976 TaxID=1317066 RepID=A0A081ASR8_PHYNI|nr:hypothetical protein F444_03844 [Phytophthora nicotianae P1976]
MEGDVGAILTLLLALLPLVALAAEARRQCRHRVRVDWKAHGGLLVDEGQFQKCYKMSYESFMALATKLDPYLRVDEKQSRNRTGVEPISPVNKLHMCLRWLGGGSYHDIRVTSGVSVSAFYASIHEVVDTIVDHPDLQLQFPSTIATQRYAAKQFENLSSSRVLKGCVVAIDGWLCPIRVPKKDEVSRVRSFFSGHYRRYGVNVQACCDHLSRFTAVACSSPGGTGDAVAFLKWRLSSVVSKFPAGLYVVADNAYTNTNQLLTPFPRPRISTTFHDSYNFHLSQLRIRIEMAFGLLVSKWRVFNAPMEIAFNRVSCTILAACILHNWCINRRLQEDIFYRVDNDEDLAEALDATVESSDASRDVTVATQDTSRYRQLYDSSDLLVDTDTYNSSEWIRGAVVDLLERDTILRPQLNQARRRRETQEQ